MELPGHGAHGFRVDEHAARLGAHDDVGRDAAFVQPLHLRIDRGCADAAGHEEEALAPQLLGRRRDELRGAAQRSGEVGERVAFAEGADFARRGADGLDDQRDASLRRVVVRNGERDAVAAFVRADDDELSGTGRTRDARRENFHQPDLFGQSAFFENGVHRYRVVSVCVSFLRGRGVTLR